MSKIVKGIELMQMISDGKIKDGTELVNNIGTKFIYLDKELCRVVGNEYQNILRGKVYSELLYFLNEETFEILEDKTEEIEEIDTLYSMLDFTDIRFCKGEIDFNFKEIQDKINELVKAVNKLNKQDTEIDRNCISD